MPIAVDRRAAADLSGRFDEALDLVRNEFDGLDAHRQYRNAFARLLKPDPLERVLMMGTDQRDLFVPELRRTIARVVPPGGHLLDVGAGDGQTFALVADAVPAGTTVSIEEPNAAYVSRYVAFLRTQAHLQPGPALVTTFDAMDETAAREQAPLPADGSVDLVLALHMLFFLEDLASGLERMTRFLKPGGEVVAVVADESDGFTGLVLRAFIATGGDTGANARHLSAIGERQRLLAAPEHGGGGIVEHLAHAGHPVRLQAVRQPSRLYGHTLADLIALSTISVLSEVPGIEKFEVATELLRTRPDAVDLRIEDEGPRAGMWSVKQPQWVSHVTRLDDEGGPARRTPRPQPTGSRLASRSRAS